MITRRLSLCSLALFFFSGCGGGSRIVTEPNLNVTGTRIYALAVMNDGSLIASGGQTAHLHHEADNSNLDPGSDPDVNTYKLVGFTSFYNAETAQELRTLEYKNDLVSLAASPKRDTIAFGSTDHRVRVYDFVTGKIRWEGAEHAGKIEGIAYSPDGETLASIGSDDKTILLQRVLDGTVIWSISIDKGQNTALAYSPDGTKIAVTAGAFVNLYSGSTGELIHTFRGGVGQLYALTYSPDGNWIATGGAGSLVSVYSARDYTVQSDLNGHVDDVLSLSFSPDSRLLLSGSKDATAILWDYVGKRRRLLLDRDGVGVVNAVVFTADGTRFILGRDEGIIYIYDTRTGQLVQKIG